MQPAPTIPFVDVSAQYRAYRGEIDSAMQDVVSSGRFILGPVVEALEEELAKYVGAKHCIACSSGTDALLLAFLALGVDRGDEIITTPFTFFATGEVIRLLGATPVFVDIDERSYNIDASLVEAAITDRTRAIVPVGLFGQTADMDAIRAIAKRHDLPVVEDAAQSFGAEYKGRRSGNLGDIGCTSFFPAKPLGAYGDGGAVFTDDDELATLLRSLANHGQGERYHHLHIGINGRLDALQAAVLRVKLAHFDEERERRNRNAARYTDAFSSLASVTAPVIMPGQTSTWAQYSIRISERDDVMRELARDGVPTAVHYPLPLYRQDALSDLNLNPAAFLVTERVCKEIMSLPMCAFLETANQDVVIASVRRLGERSRK
jgi:UDP-2-acetamido-2-deoxy-ribo-hexuluronate aminotransferase